MSGKAGAKPKTLGRPPLPAGERRVDVHVRLSPLALRVLDLMAGRNEQSRTAQLEQLIIDHADSKDPR